MLQVLFRASSVDAANFTGGGNVINISIFKRGCSFGSMFFFVAQDSHLS